MLWAVCCPASFLSAFIRPEDPEPNMLASLLPSIFATCWDLWSTTSSPKQPTMPSWAPFESLLPTEFHQTCWAWTYSTAFPPSLIFLAPWALLGTQSRPEQSTISGAPLFSSDLSVYLRQTRGSWTWYRPPDPVPFRPDDLEPYIPRKSNRGLPQSPPDAYYKTSQGLSDV